MNFELVSTFSPTGDQPQAIMQISDGLTALERFQTLLGVTGSGKTFTIANVINEVNRPTLVLSHNKTLAAQLYSEFKQFFPNNAVEYFVSYYDYYQPEAYIPSTGTYIEKDLSINQEIEKLRLNTTSSLLSGRKDIIVVSSVSCIYGIGNPEDFNAGMIEIKVGYLISRNHLLQKFVSALYSRTEGEFERGNFRVKGDTVDVFPAYTDIAYRIHFFGNKVEEIESINPASGNVFESVEMIRVYPASIFVASKDKVHGAISNIQDDLCEQIEFFEKSALKTEAKRIKERTEFDLEMIKELGYCSGIENYSRYFDGRIAGTRPFCLLDYFPDDYITVIDESHVTLPQVRAMFGGDRSRKETLVEHGFRLPAALDNRPLKFSEFEDLCNQTIYVSATPSDYEIEKCEGVIIEQLIRPTGLLDPEISVRATENQIDDLLEEIRLRIERHERILVITLTKRMAEEFTKYLEKFSIKCNYIHSDVPTLERVEIISGLKNGAFDVLIGVNLLREGLDLPEVSLVAILDADKEGFLRSEKALIQTSGRAARNINGLVIMYADKITNSMQKAIDDNKRKRKTQKIYNAKHNITPTQIGRKADNALVKRLSPYNKEESKGMAIEKLSKKQLQKSITETKREMETAAKEFDFIRAKKLRDRLFELKNKLESKK
ncbi:MAG: excinuclease ABC subunit UvrB [Bacteroidota bacterium]|nr:excinuclease ABC subunit UvrB [Bacteroidota bacterium]